MPSKKVVTHQSFLLRCWQERRTDPKQPAVWRFMLKEVSTAQQQHTFATFEQLVTFLRQEFVEGSFDRDEINLPCDQY